jgi:hypothetical protein
VTPASIAGVTRKRLVNPAEVLTITRLFDASHVVALLVESESKKPRRRC